MLQLKNQTPFQSTLSLLPDANGVDTLFVAVKATFTFVDSQIEIAEQQQPVHLEDEYWGDPAESSL